MNVLLTSAVYIAFVVFEYCLLRKRFARKEKWIYLVLGGLAILSALPASVGMNFESVGSSLSGMISLFMH